MKTITPEQFLREKYLLVGFHNLTINGKPWLEIMEEYGSQQFTAGVEAGKKEREFIPDIEEAAIHQWDMHYGMGKDEQIKPYVIEDFKAGAEWMKNRIEQESKWIPVVNNASIEKYKDLWLSDGKWVVPGYLDRNNDFRAFNSDDTLRGVKYCKSINRPSPPNPDKGGKEKNEVSEI